MKNKDIILFILTICIIYLLYCNSNKEPFTAESSTPMSSNNDIINLINNAVDKKMTNRNNITITDSIKNLGLLAKKIQNKNGYTFPSNLNVTSDLNITGELNLLPGGTIVMWSKEVVPDGWIKCDGTIYLKEEFKNDLLSSGELLSNYSVISISLLESLKIDEKLHQDIEANKFKYFITPDLRGRFVLGSGQPRKRGNVLTKHETSADYSTNFELNNTGGWEEHKMIIDEMPSHDHEFTAVLTGPLSQGDREDGEYLNGAGGPTDSHTKFTGENFPHNNMPPYYVLIYIMKVYLI